LSGRPGARLGVGGAGTIDSILTRLYADLDAPTRRISLLTK
jgi:hypothetical protein